ncbi:MAG: hypothetical protein K8F30_02720 [Taibaiella sp.]|nr:hypothetical protein [Taibaiella sp.]
MMQQSFLPSEPIKGDHIRREWHNDEWYFSVIDVIAELLATDHKKAKAYWATLKKRIATYEPALIASCTQLKMSSSDGKQYFTYAANTATCIKIKAHVERVSFHKERRKRQNRDELGNFQPLVASMLRQEQWSVQQWVHLPSGRIIDLVAQRNQEIWVVECKLSLLRQGLFEAIGQALCYVAEYNPSATPVVASFDHKIDEYAYTCCQHLGISVLAVPAHDLGDTHSCASAINQ